MLEVTETAKRRGALEHYYSSSGPRAGIAVGVMDLLSTALRHGLPGIRTAATGGREGG